MPPKDRDFADAGRLTHLLWEVSTRALSVAETALADSPLTTASAGILDAVASKPGTSIADLARWLPTSAQAISQIAGRLEGLGHLERRLGARGRGVALFITAAGTRAREDADQRISNANRELARTLGTDEHHQLLRLLEHARAALETAHTTAP